MGWGRPRGKSGLRGRSRGAGAESQGQPAAEGSVTPWARVWGGGWQSCSWLGIGFLSGREGARRGERGQQQQAHPCLSPSHTSLLLEKRGNCEPRVGRAGLGPQIGRGGPGGWAEFTPLSRSLGSLSPHKSSAPSLFFRE